jgi:thioester reductase-like protein
MADIEAALGCALPIDAVTEHATIRSLCAAVDHPIVVQDFSFDGMRADAVLASDILPAPNRCLHGLRQATTILLTGATGFLGTSLLRALLDGTSARILCLARPTGQSVARRISAMTAGRDAHRVLAVDGDLSAPRLGLQDRIWRDLREQVDAVCHAGASIDWVKPYGMLRSVNVLATHDLLRLASEAGASFDFVSSLSVCYSSHGPRSIDESFDPLPHLEHLHFGYAHTKAVAEALVRQAGQRGLRTRIHRPTLISGDSQSGRFNPHDLLSALIAGCVRMGIAPDLDWELDAMPVDCVADAIVHLSDVDLDTSHLLHARPRHWRECALWMRLYGYDVRLVPYRAWTDRLRRDVSADVRHPLHALRAFFLDAASDGLTIPELHERDRRSKVMAQLTGDQLRRTGRDAPSLDARLMERYFDAFVRGGMLSEPRGQSEPVTRRRTTSGRARGSPDELVRAMLKDAGIRPRAVSIATFGTDESIISELTAWRAGSTSGLFHVTADRRELVLKVKPDADEAVAVGEALAGLCGERLGAAYGAWGAALGVRYGHAREVALYRQADPRVRALLPPVIATRADDDTKTWAVLLERIRSPLMNAVDRPERWIPHIDTVIDGLARLQWSWMGQIASLRDRPWMDRVRTTADVVQMAPLWIAMAQHAEPMLASCGLSSLSALTRRLIDSAATWRPRAEALPQTLIHNDFNPRNMCLRRRGSRLTLCAFDWELATIGAPTRDLAEFLCFVAADCTPDGIRSWIDRHRRTFGDLSGTAIDREAWNAAFVAGLCEFLIDRIGVYALVHRVKPQTFLPRVLRTWMEIFALMDGHALAA